ncbi:MAG TPA: iron-sulfur cluster-binding domain-containing protein [Steroidobacteraceae bacterium]|nr:iron-sulfur cluster-binding domain-containing protein [Steroidobacteraceae bacterium]
MVHWTRLRFVAACGAHTTSSPTWPDRVEITVKREPYGVASRWLHDELRLGDEVEIEAPSGTLTFSGKEADSILLVGAAVGIILDAADEAGVFIDNACRSGTCGSCRVKLLSGSVTMDAQDALSAPEKAEGYILACQATGRGEIAVDA